MSTISKEIKNYYSIVYQITQECPFTCDICLRYYKIGDSSLSPEERIHMVDILKKHNVGSITVTGGEPTILKDNLFSFLKHVHKKRIHTCLSTTGFRLNEERVKEMDGYLDRMLISIRSLIKKDWIIDFGDTRYTSELFETVLNLLHWIKSTGIILEICTTVHKEDIDRVISLGWQLKEINPNIVWRIDEYYPIGIGAHNQARFKLEDHQFEQTCTCISQTFSDYFRDIRFSSWSDRQNFPGLMVTHTGDIITTSNQTTGFNILKDGFPEKFEMSKPWAAYKKVSRDWGWGDLE